MSKVCSNATEDHGDHNSDVKMTDNIHLEAAPRSLAELIKAARFRSQKKYNDRNEWRKGELQAELEHLKARISEKETEIEANKEYMAERESQLQVDAVVSGLSA